MHKFQFHTNISEIFKFNYRHVNKIVVFPQYWNYAMNIFKRGQILRRNWLYLQNVEDVLKLLKEIVYYRIYF